MTTRPVALALAETGWDIANAYWRPYDATMPWGSAPSEVDQLALHLQECGAATAAVAADLADPGTPTAIFATVEAQRGPVTGLLLAHCHGIDSGLLDTMVESFDRHFAVNTRGAWLLMREFGLRYRGAWGRGRILALTSDHVVGNLPYGAGKGALDRITLAAAAELRHLGITANVIDRRWPPLHDTFCLVASANRRTVPIS